MNKKSPFILKQELEALEIKPNEIWKHYKGEYYLVKHLSIDCNTNELLVNYENFSNRELEGILFTRSYSEWNEEISPGITRFSPSYMAYIPD